MIFAPYSLPFLSLPLLHVLSRIVNSAKDVMFLPVLVCLPFCLSVSKITQKVIDGF